MDESLKKVKATAGGSVYDILIGDGAFAETGGYASELLGRGFALFVNERVWELHGDYVRECVAAFPNHDVFVMPDGEEHKNYRHAGQALEWMLERHYSRGSCVLAVGGGVTGDFAGYVAALYMRGIPVIHAPTTLLAMVDSSIGGKVAVNIGRGKNIVGAFHQPALVVSDVRFLATLPEREQKNGLTEVLKHGFIGDADILKIFQAHDLHSLCDADVLQEIVYRSALFKSSIVARDEREGGLRSILNFGHTVGHAIESFYEYSGISHGEAVAVGLKAEIEISRRMGMLSDDESDMAIALIERYGLAKSGMRLDADGILQHMMFDKKNRGGRILCVLLDGVGRPVYDRTVDDDLIIDVVSKL